MEQPLITIPHQQISILAGASGSGKTTLLVATIAAWAKGEQFTPAINWTATRIAYLVSDRTADEVIIRAKRYKIPEGKLEIYGFLNDLSFNTKLLKEPELALRKCMSKFKNPYDLLVIDPIALFIAGDTNNYREVAMSLITLNRLAIEKDITIFGVHHASKSRSDFGFKRPQDRINGSGAFQGYSGTQMVLIEGKEDNLPYDRLFVIPHMSAEQKVSLIRDESGEFVILPPEESDLAPEVQGLAHLSKYTLGEVFKITSLHSFADREGLSRADMMEVVRKELATGKLKKVGKGEYCRVT